jgi:hypothetical protein
VRPAQLVPPVAKKVLEFLAARLECVAMHNNSRTLERPADPGASEPVPPTRILFEAVARQLCVETAYNKAEVLLAPHIIYTRHGELFVDAVTVHRAGQPPREQKLGTFKLAGLGAIALSERSFTAFPEYEPQAEKYQGVTIFALGG